MVKAEKITMLNIWSYMASNGTAQRGAMLGYADRGGTDVSYRFHRVDSHGASIMYSNGGFLLDIISGYALKNATRIGNMPNPALTNGESS